MGKELYLSTSKAKKIIRNFSKGKILVIGDLMLDIFLWGTVDRISPEAPVPVVKVQRQSYMAGGAVNVASNISSLKGECLLAGLLGNDDVGLKLIKKAKKDGVKLDCVIKSNKYTTTVKSRVIAQHQQVVRFDQEQHNTIDSKQKNKWFRKISRAIEYVDAIIVEDYGKGVVDQDLINFLIKESSEKRKMIAIDPRMGSNYDFTGATIITPNIAEALYFSGYDTKKELKNRDYKAIGKQLCAKWKCDVVLVTLGENGMMLIKKTGQVLTIPAVAREVYDVSGAGDTVIGTFMLALASKVQIEEAAWLANEAAGVVVGKLGTATVSQKELLERFR